MQHSSGVRDRLFSKISIDNADGCWEWQGALAGDRRGKSNRYGQMKVNGRLAYVHRIAYELANGPIPAGLFVLHRCDNTKCCNPAHLFLGTLKDNTRDCEAKGRGNHPAGQKHPMAKLTAWDVWLIRSLHATGEFILQDLAGAFGVRFGHISEIVKGRVWKGGPFAGDKPPA